MTLTQAQLLGVDRVIEPAGALPQGARRLDAETPPGPHELGVDVEFLNLDSTSHAQLREQTGNDPPALAEEIAAIVRERGKMHNPVTNSGGILVGAVAVVGSAFPAEGLRVGERVATLASLTLTPLRLEHIGPLDPRSPQIPVRGRAIVTASAPWARVPDDLPLDLVLAALDVYGAASHARDLTRAPAQVLVLGAGRAGLLAAAAATDAGAFVTVADLVPHALERARAAGVCTTAVAIDATDALATMEALALQGVPPADLTVVVVNQPRCELAAVLATAQTGTVLFFSMATSFTAAALGSEGVASTARMLIGSGYALDRGQYALGLLRRNPRLRAAFEQAA